MFEYLQPRNGPVVEGMESQEVVYAKNQPEYIPLRTLRNSRDSYVPVVSRWSPTPEQRKLIADGADIFLELSTFGGPLSPIRMGIGDGKIECPADRVFSLEIPAPVVEAIADSEFIKAVGIKEE
jgi:hypothetical protein